MHPNPDCGDFRGKSGNLQFHIPVRRPGCAGFPPFQSGYIFAAREHGAFSGTGIGEYFLFRTKGVDLSIVQNSNAVRQPVYLVPVMGHQHHGFAEIPDNFTHFTFQTESKVVVQC